MNTLLISSAEALSLAFTPAEFQREELIPAVTIETAQLRYLKPAFGPLYDCLNEPRYEAFVERYVKPALACYVRALVIDARAAAVGPSGIVQARTQYTEAAPAEAAGRLRRQALRDAETLLEEAIEFVERHPEDFPEYDPDLGIRRRVLFKGGLILPDDRPRSSLPFCSPRCSACSPRSRRSSAARWPTSASIS